MLYLSNVNDSSPGFAARSHERLRIPQAAVARVAAIAHGSIPYIGRFPVPAELARDVGIDVVVADLPGRRTEIADAQTIWVRPHEEQRELGTRIFRGLASAIIGPVRRTPAQICTFAAWLAAPTELVLLAGGLDEAIEAQEWATDELIRLWWTPM